MNQDGIQFPLLVSSGTHCQPEFNISKSLYLVPYVQDVVTIIGLAYYQNSRGL